MAGERRGLLGGRDWRGQTIAMLGVGVGAVVLGFAAGSLGRQVLATRLARADAANLELRESVETLEAGLRDGRAPLQRRIHELEQALEDTKPPRPPLLPEETEAERKLKARVAALETELAAAQDGRSAGRELETEVARLTRAVKAAERARGKLAAENERLARQLAEKASELERAAALAQAPLAPPAAPLPAAPAPAVDARAEPPATVAAAPGAAACATLEDPAFTLELAGAGAERLGGRLVLRLAEASGGLALELGEPDDPTGRGGRFRLDSLPQHVSFDCAGTPYIVSVCSVEAQTRARGVVWQADSWRDPCR